MDTTAVSSAGSFPQTSSSPIGQDLGRDEFLKLLVAKLANQDPLSPTQDTEFVAQLATFSSLEQLISVNSRLDMLALGQNELVNSQALELIGKAALVEAGDTVSIKNGLPDELLYSVPASTAEATLTIRDADGNIVRTFELDPSSGGRIELDWASGQSKGQALTDGDYTIEVHAVDELGGPVDIALFRSLTIDGISFADGVIRLVSGDTAIAFGSIVEIRDGRD